jgi:hypothetical protein
MREIEIILGETSYRVRQAPIRREAIWRRELQEQLAPVLDLVANAQTIEFSSPADLAAFVRRVAPLLLDATDIMLELLFSYAPELADQRAQIEETAYSDEVLAAMKGVLRLAYPFLADLTQLAELGRTSMGSGAPPTTSPTTSTS